MAAAMSRPSSSPGADGCQRTEGADPRVSGLQETTTVLSGKADTDLQRQTLDQRHRSLSKAEIAELHQTVLVLRAALEESREDARAAALGAAAASRAEIAQLQETVQTLRVT